MRKLFKLQAMLSREEQAEGLPVKSLNDLLAASTFGGNDTETDPNDGNSGCTNPGCNNNVCSAQASNLDCTNSGCNTRFQTNTQCSNTGCTN